MMLLQPNQEPAVILSGCSPGNATDATGESGADDVLRSHLVGYHCVAGDPRAQVG